MKYISLGGNCSVTYQLKNLGLKYESYPFDWSKITINQLISVLENNFTNYDSSIKIHKLSNLHNNTYLLKNNYNVTFAHEVTDENQLNEFKEKIKRRITRFYNLENVVFIRIELTKISIEKIINLYNVLEKFVRNYKLIVIVHKQYKFNINVPNIYILYFDNFSDDWQMNHFDWQQITYLIK